MSEPATVESELLLGGLEVGCIVVTVMPLPYIVTYLGIVLLKICGVWETCAALWGA